MNLCNCEVSDVPSSLVKPENEFMGHCTGCNLMGIIKDIIEISPRKLFSAVFTGINFEHRLIVPVCVFSKHALYW